MEYKENHEEDVEVMGVKEELEHFPPDARVGCCPHDKSRQQR
jgi:hypothetical protein